tara:strand:+ start:2196 stop:2420 length:225 start_codon:yes stop_codon:yes gene_type:complete
MNDLLTDLAFCIEDCEMTDEQTGEYLSCCENLGVNCEYFAEEFIVLGDKEVHSDDYLSLDAFNAYHGIYFEEVE